MKHLIGRFGRSRSGATAIEYALMAMVVALAIISSVTLIGKSVVNDFTAAGNGFASSS